MEDEQKIWDWETEGDEIFGGTSSKGGIQVVWVGFN